MVRRIPRQRPRPTARATAHARPFVGLDLKVSVTNTRHLGIKGRAVSPCTCACCRSPVYTLGFPAVPLVAGSPLFTLTNGATATVTLEAIPDMYSPFVACRFMLSNGQHLSGGGGSSLTSGPHAARLSEIGRSTPRDDRLAIPRHVEFVLLCDYFFTGQLHLPARLPQPPTRGRAYDALGPRFECEEIGSQSAAAVSSTKKLTVAVVSLLGKKSPPSLPSAFPDAGSRDRESNVVTLRIGQIPHM